ncbi:MAG TPA: GIY-YIG nuclease family protein [Terriglobales bacterium]|nr:GIY-YIG nuclease family protein [Terriglobales bacterium]
MRAENRYYVYIMASLSLTLYTGVTGNLRRRALQHKSREIDGFTKQYRIHRLVYYETFKYVNNAIAREKQIKAWTRAKRIALIKTMNPTWQDLAEAWGDPIKLQIPHFVRDDNSKSEGASTEVEKRVRKEENVSDPIPTVKKSSRNTA